MFRRRRTVVGDLQVRGPRLQVHHNCFHSEVSIHLDFFSFEGSLLEEHLPVDLGRIVAEPDYPSYYKTRTLATERQPIGSSRKTT